ncbi:hypothetical protein ABT010_29600 [Streptomyces sp. NPDC002668]|uniref:hypothetical protein n=1 Tax=Streptomyces sp. NPDC002668 TaxID=3154422 RepID=UPI00331F8D9D
MTDPPWDEMVCTPEPPSSQPWLEGADGLSGGRELGRAAGVGVAVRGFSALLEGVGSGLALAEALGVGVGVAEARAEAAKSVGADCATGAVGLVDPTTKWTVMMTAVTLAAVHDSQMSR